MKTSHFKPLDDSRKNNGAGSGARKGKTSEFEKNLLAMDPEQKKNAQAKSSIRALESEILREKNELVAVGQKMAAIKAEIAKLEDKREKRIGCALKKIKERQDIELHEYYAFANIESMLEKASAPFSFGVVYYAAQSDVKLREIDSDGNEKKNMGFGEFCAYGAATVDRLTKEWISEIGRIKTKHSLIFARKEMARAGFVVDWAGLSEESAEDDRIIEWLNAPEGEKRNAVLAKAVERAKKLDGRAAREIFKRMDDVNVQDVFAEMRDIYAGLLGAIGHFRGNVNFVKACQAETAMAAKLLKDRHETIRMSAEKLREIGKKRYIYMNNLENENNCLVDIASLSEDISKKSSELASVGYKEQLLANQLSWRKNELEQLKNSAGI